MKKIIFRILIGILIIIAVVVYVNYSSERSVKLATKFYDHFNAKKIIGKIEYIGISHHGAKFRIEGVEDEFIFWPNTSKTNDCKIFTRCAEKGDTIVKPAYSDTLRLIKNGKEYFYTFGKPDVLYD
jgi:hypothetical protein